MRKVFRKKLEEIDTIISNLDLFSRILIGQYDEIIEKISGIFIYHENEVPELTKALVCLRCELIPELKCYSLSGSLGIWNDVTPLIAKRAYDIQQVLRYQLSYHRNPEGGITVNFNTPYLHGEWGVSKELVNEYHSILIRNNYPAYREGYVIMYPWTCPVILDNFNDETQEVDLIIDADEAVEIIRLANEWKELIMEKDFFALFNQVKEYSHPDISSVQIKSYTDIISRETQKYLKTLEEWFSKPLPANTEKEDDNNERPK